MATRENNTENAMIRLSMDAGEVGLYQPRSRREALALTHRTISNESTEIAERIGGLLAEFEQVFPDAPERIAMAGEAIPQAEEHLHRMVSGWASAIVPVRAVPTRDDVEKAREANEKRNEKRLERGETPRDFDETKWMTGRIAARDKAVESREFNHALMLVRGYSKLTRSLVESIRASARAANYKLAPAQKQWIAAILTGSRDLAALVTGDGDATQG